ncbi:MAG: hypothetical protein ACT4OG_00900 [Alphaproteobacteria bacterium]
MPESTSQTNTSGPRVGFGRFSIKLPRNKALRIGLGLLLCLGAVFWFLPILGLWMLPLGILVLAVDFPPARRLSHWTVERWKESSSWRERWWGWWRRKPRDKGPE